MFHCDRCGKSFSRKDNMRRHQMQSCRPDNDAGPPAKRPRVDSAQPSAVQELCNYCNRMVPVNRMNSHLKTLEHRTNSCTEFEDGVKIINSAFKYRIVSYRVESKNPHSDYQSFFNEVRHKVVTLIDRMVQVHNTLKVNMELFGRYILQTQEILEVKSFNSQNQIVDQSNNLEEVYRTFVDTLSAKAVEFQERDSGWTLEKVVFIEVNINKYSPLSGSSYIKLPEFIALKRAVVNVRNEDHFCFAWAVTSALRPAQTRTSEVGSYPDFRDVLNVEGIDFPMKLRDIPQFENMNDCSVNVYGLETTFENNKPKYEIVGPLYYARRKLGRHVNLLNITDESSNSHYCWIKDLSRLVSSQISSHGHRMYFCDGCLMYFSDERKLLRHQLNDCNFICTTIPTTQIKIDKCGRAIPENILKFENFERQLKVPFVVYADFESILKPIHTNEPDPIRSFTNKSFIHEPYSFSYRIRCSFDDSASKFVLYRGEDAAKVFVARLESDLRAIYYTYLNRIVPMKPLTASEENEFLTADSCGICEKPFELGDVKVRDHCHLTGKKRYGAAHSRCNLNYKLPNFVPIIFHNLSGYDCHLFIKELCTNKNKVEVIGQTKENYISFTKHLLMGTTIDKFGKLKKQSLKLRFIDSFRFMASSLQQLGESLSDEQCYETRKCFPENEKFLLMRQKGVFPYSFVKNLTTLDCTELPSKSDFYDQLNEKHISEDDYERAKRVWSLFECETLGDYSDLYLKSDVLILCDIFENFRNICLDKYKLDPAHYFTSPGHSWDAMLKYTGVELELLTDIDMITFFQKGIRGGISQCSERKHVANNRFLPDYDENEASSFITYLDATNLYGHSMSQPLPTDGFTWLSEQEILQLDIMGVPDDGPKGYVLEVDVHYPEELHDAHSDLPFLVESVIPPGSNSKIPKLIPNLNDKRKYIVHYRALRQAIENGLIVMRTHRVLSFNQSPWLKKYVDLNTLMRNQATNVYHKNIFKTRTNAVFGKTMENVDNRNDIRLVTHWESIKRATGANALIARPNFKTLSIFSEDFVAIHMGKVKINYNKPLYLGFSILDLSKTVMYEFFYKFIKKHYGSNASLLYTDTDSLILKIFTENFYDFMRDNVEKFDTSNYKVENQFAMPITEPILGNMKDEFPNDPIISFYGTGAKAYHVKSVSDELKKAKGIKKSVIKNQMSLDDYRKIVESGGTILRKMSTFRSELHDVYTLMCNKVALSYKDDKRFIIPNTTKTLPWGHKDIEFYQTSPEVNFKFLIDALKTVPNHEADSDEKLDQLIRLLEEQSDD
ncbi:uncharacterized protein [Leptinotarsa decemlineata]|uniref:uncharacterized protein n=1 Tax=Leptinotarsa decemlineata TaxID=7539 RepID=UPI003D30A6AD